MSTQPPPVCPKQFAGQAFLRPPTTRIEQVRHRLLHRAARREFEKLRRVFPVSSLEEAFPGLSRCAAVVQAAVPGTAAFANMPVHELVILSTVCAFLQPRHIFEFGTWDGLTTLHLARNSPPEARIVTIDLAPDDPIRRRAAKEAPKYNTLAGTETVGGKFADTPEAQKITQIYGNTLQFDHSPYLSAMDFVFVDAGHDYPLVRSDTEKALAMARPGGVIIWHDYFYTQWGVYTWLNELAGTLPLKNVPGTSLVYYMHPKA